MYTDYDYTLQAGPDTDAAGLFKHITEHNTVNTLRSSLYFITVCCGLAGVWFLTFHYWSCSLTLPELCTNITVSEGFMRTAEFSTDLCISHIS